MDRRYQIAQLDEQLRLVEQGDDPLRMEPLGRHERLVLYSHRLATFFSP